MQRYPLPLCLARRLVSGTGALVFDGLTPAVRGSARPAEVQHDPACP